MILSSISHGYIVNEIHPKVEIFADVKNSQVGIHFDLLDPSIVLQGVLGFPIFLRKPKK
jgi:hypothetical protein